MRKILVTEPHQPSRAAFQALVDQIWERNWLTNNGPLVQELEGLLAQRLDIPTLAYVSNGTLALQLALEALDIRGDVLTTAFSYVATASSIAWQHCNPVMVDICPDTLNIDPACIEKCLTPDTTCILATHVFGNPCDVHALEAIARKHDLKIIYDGAHAFGTTYLDRSVLSYGDVSTVSFHSTKLYHSIEGGGVVCADPAVAARVGAMRNFGIDAQGEIAMVGINAKNSEFHAAMGLCNLKEFDAILATRQSISKTYDEAFQDLPMVRPMTPAGTAYNYAYYPVIFGSEAILLDTLAAMNAQNIFPRRYFYPSLSTLPYVEDRENTPIADDIARRVACLPLHTNLTAADVRRVCEVFRASLTVAAARHERTAAVA
jgi:dTDP-4-amino-4,6-dideoxygalactose transaminase